MGRENEWGERLKETLAEEFKNTSIEVRARQRLPYRFNIISHKTSAVPTDLEDHERNVNEYEVDLLLVENISSGWIPRVAVELKWGGVSSHDALTYSAKASTHKTVYPFLRYGFAIAEFDESLPQRLLRHGEHFDFMIALAPETENGGDQVTFRNLLRAEFSASQELSRIGVRGSGVRLVHKQLLVK